MSAFCIEKRRVGSCATFSFFLSHFPHICHEDQVCLAARDMNLDVECPSLCLFTSCGRSSTGAQRETTIPRRLVLAGYGYPFVDSPCRGFHPSDTGYRTGKCPFTGLFEDMVYAISATWPTFDMFGRAVLVFGFGLEMMTPMEGDSMLSTFSSGLDAILRPRRVGIWGRGTRAEIIPPKGL